MYPGSLDELGVEDLLPAVEALHVSSVDEEAGNTLPVSGAKLIHELLKLIIFLGCPPSLLSIELFVGAVGGG